MTTDILQRSPRQQKRRPVCVYDWQQSALHRVGVSVDHFDTPCPLTVILARLGGIFSSGVHLTLYVRAGAHVESAPPASWYKRPVTDGWLVQYRHDSSPARRTAHYTREDMPTIELRHTSAWFGDSNPSAPNALGALRLLDQQIGEHFGSKHEDGVHAFTLATPAQTGLDLLAKSLPFGGEYLLLDSDTRQLIHSTSTQARIELFQQESRKVDQLWCYDQRFAYAAQLGTHLPLVFPTAPLERIAKDTLIAPQTIDYYRPARYRVSWKVPEWWRHVGILPELMSDGWTWPSKPGGWHHGWVDSHELMLAYNHDWQVNIHEALLFAKTSSRRIHEPLREWKTKLIEMWKLLSVWERDGDVISGLAKDGIRSMVLGTIGSFATRSSRATVVLPMGGAIPEDDNMLEPPRMTADGLEYVTRLPIHPYMLRWQHPEWAAKIWARQRVTLTQALLQQERSSLVACNTDGFESTKPAQVVDLIAPTQPGSWRLTGHKTFSPARDWPSVPFELAELKEEAEKQRTLEPITPCDCARCTVTRQVR